MVVFFWLMIYKRDHLTLALELELWGAFPFANWSPVGETDASGHAPHPRGLGAAASSHADLAPQGLLSLWWE